MKNWRLVLIVLLFFVTFHVSFGETIRFAVIGDTQGSGQGAGVNETAFPIIVDKVANVNPPVQFVMTVGDLVRGSNLSWAMSAQLRRWRELAQPWYDANYFGLKVYPTPGNHDQQSETNYPRLWRQTFPELPTHGPAYDIQRTYSFDVGPCHFAVVNTASPMILREHRVDLDWLAADLANSDKPFKLVFGHDPAFPAVRHFGTSLDMYPDLRDQFWQILKDNNVKAYFCGHEHVLDHWIKDDVHQIIAGTSGADLGPYNFIIVDADENDATVSVFNASDDSLLDQYKLSDTSNVPSEARTSSGTPPLPCMNWALPFVMILLYFSASLRYNENA